MGLFGIVWDLRGYVSGLFDYLLGRDVIEWDAASLLGMTEGMSCEAVKTFWYRVRYLACSGEFEGWL